MKETLPLSSILSILFLISLSSCTKDVKKDEPFYVRGIINNELINWEVPQKTNRTEAHEFFASIAGLSKSLTSDCVNYKCYDIGVGFSMMKRVQLVTKDNALEAYYVLSTKSLDTKQLRSVYNSGPLPFGKYRSDITDPEINGIIVNYYDKNQKVWSSQLGDQTGSSFTINEIQDVNVDYDLYTTIWKATLTCKLYDIAGNNLVISDVKIYGPCMPPN